MMKTVFHRRAGALLLTLVLACSLAAPAAAAPDRDGTAWRSSRETGSAGAGGVTAYYDPAPAPATPKVTRVEMRSALELAPDGAERLTATVIVDPADDRTLDKGVTWKKASGGSSRITVAADGTVRAAEDAVAGDTATIVATSKADPTKTASCRITIKPASVSGVRIKNGEEVTVDREGLTVQLEVEVTPPGAADKTVQWGSSNSAVASVDGNGLVTARTPGEATITVVSNADRTKADTCEISVSGITLSETAVTLKVNQTKDVEYGAYGKASGHLVWTSEDPVVATALNGRIVGNAVGKTTITLSNPGTNYQKKIEVTVVENIAPYTAPAINAGQNLSFADIISGLDAVCKKETASGKKLKSVSSLTVATSQGIVHHSYISPDTPNHGVGGSETYYVNPDRTSGQLALSDVKYVPASGFSGTATISYIGHSEAGETYNGTIEVQVRSTGDVAYSTAMNRALELTSKEFKDMCQIKTGRSASYVTFTQPSASKGTLYYNYSPSQWSQKVDGSTRYYMGSNPSLEKVTFVPAQNFTGTVSISYRCTDTTGGSYSGTMTINVYAADGGGNGGVEYTTGINRNVTLNASDFNSACQSFNGRRLSYILFEELPPSSQGILYYNYSSSSSNRVDTDTRYNRSNTSPRISSITFVPASNFSGTVTIPYTGYDTAGQTYPDNLVIHVTDAAGTVYYTTGVDDPVTFRGEDFNEACQRVNNASLNYITFTLPSSSMGTLWRNYRSSSNTGTRVSSSQHYYRGGNPSLSDITFVPKSRYEGTVSIPFSGRDASGAEFEGSVSITVGQGTGRVVSYSTASGGVVRFSASDFNAACRTATGDDLSYLSFDLPASRYGTLYYQYNAARGTGSPVATSNSYYRSGGSRLLDDVYFASANVNGIASFQYTARSTGGERFTGTVEIAIGNAAMDSGYSNGTRYIGSSAPISLRTQDFEAACQSAVGGALSHIRFNSLPGENAGRLYMNYESPSRPGAPATTTSNYTASSGLSIGQLSFVPKAGYQGQVNIPYTGYSTQGSSFSGNVILDISNSYCATPFYDVDSGWDWAKPSVEFLRNAGISNGYSDSSFRPSRSISRGEFTLMVCRAFGFDTTAKVSSFPDVPASSPYAGAVATAKSMGIVEGSGGRFRPDSAITRQSAMTIICRAMRAAGRKVPATGGSALNAYSDQARIASHARDSVAALVSLGVVRGSTDMRINPTRSISRAEMAVILHRVLTL